MKDQEMMNLILDTHQRSMEMIIEMQIQLAALEVALVYVAPDIADAAKFLVEQVGVQRNRHRETLQKVQTTLAHCREEVSRIVQ
jgi:hypothetical protein